VNVSLLSSITRTRSALGGAMTSSALFRRRRQAQSLSRVVAIKARAGGGKFGFRTGTPPCYTVYSGVLLKSMANAKAVVSNDANSCRKQRLAQLPLVRLMCGRHYRSVLLCRSQYSHSGWQNLSFIAFG